MNGGLITKNTSTPRIEPVIAEFLGPNLLTLDGNSTLTSREESLVRRVMGKYPWIEEQFREVTSLTLRLGDDPIRAALVDILDERLIASQLHSCKEGRDWRRLMASPPI